MIGQIFMKDFGEWTKEEQEAFAETINYPVRKAAHATEYAILGMLVSGTAYAYGICGKKAMRYAWIWATFYAATDEFHQLFVPGRSGQIRDVILDSAGAAVGILILCRVGRVRQRVARKK